MTSCEKERKSVKGKQRRKSTFVIYVSLHNSALGIVCVHLHSVN